MDKLIDLSLAKFISTTASAEPVPGGGSVSALCGSLSAALAAMVANLTIGKKKYADVQPIMEELSAKLTSVASLLIKAVDMDSDAYNLVFEAYKMPKNTDEEREVRAASIQMALQNAATVPFSVCKIVNTFLADLVEIAEKGNKNAVTDAYVASLCARTAVLGAAANVKINLASIDDEQFCAPMRADLDIIAKNAEETEQKIRNIMDQSF